MRWFAAANTAARDATDVGILLADTILMLKADGTTGWKSKTVKGQMINDAFVFPGKDADVYNSNRWKVTYSTTKAGVPVVESIYLPQRTDGQTMESNGVNADLTASDAAVFVPAFESTALSSFGTAVIAVLEIVVNDI